MYQVYQQYRISLLKLLPPIELSAFIAHLLPVGLTGIGPTTAFLLLFLASPPDKQEEDEDKYNSHNALFVC